MTFQIGDAVRIIQTDATTDSGIPDQCLWKIGKIISEDDDFYRTYDVLIDGEEFCWCCVDADMRRACPFIVWCRRIWDSFRLERW